MISVTLTATELTVLDRQHPSTRNNGGWQSLLVDLQQQVNRTTRVLTLSISDIERIRRYAFTYGNGGWENRLRAIFERTLGPTLGSQFLPNVEAA